MHPPLTQSRAYLETHKGDLHGENGAQAVNSTVGHIDPVGETSCEHQHQYVERDQVDQEHIASPRRDLCRIEKNDSSEHSSSDCNHYAFGYYL